MASPKANGGWKGERGTSTQRGYGTAWRKLRNAVMRCNIPKSRSGNA